MHISWGDKVSFQSCHGKKTNVGVPLQTTLHYFCLTLKKPKPVSLSAPEKNHRRTQTCLCLSSDLSLTLSHTLFLILWPLCPEFTNPPYTWSCSLQFYFIQVGFDFGIATESIERINILLLEQGTILPLTHLLILYIWVLLFLWHQETYKEKLSLSFFSSILLRFPTVLLH